jgi:hypothetical protein
LLPKFIAFWVIWALQPVIVLPFGPAKGFTTTYSNWLENDAFAIVKVSHLSFSAVGRFLAMNSELTGSTEPFPVASSGPFIVTSVGERTLRR